MISNKKPAPTINPIPPMKLRKIIIDLPITLQPNSVSKGTNPVTVTAEVETKM